MIQKQQKKLLHLLSQEIAQQLGEKLDRVLVYGSYARGEARSDSDIDILIVVRGKFDYATLIQQTSELFSRLSLENDLVISRAFISDEHFKTECSPFTLNVQREGILI